VPDGEIDRLGAVVRIGDHLHVRLPVDDHANAGSHQRLVVGDQHPDRHDVRGSTGGAAAPGDTATSAASTSVAPDPAGLGVIGGVDR
jgi:hypothetical protein